MTKSITGVNKVASVLLPMFRTRIVFNKCFNTVTTTVMDGVKMHFQEISSIDKYYGSYRYAQPFPRRFKRESFDKAMHAIHHARLTKKTRATTCNVRDTSFPPAIYFTLYIAGSKHFTCMGRALQGSYIDQKWRTKKRRPIDIIKA